MTITTTKYDIGQEVYPILNRQLTYPVYDLPPGYPQREVEPATYRWEVVTCGPMKITYIALNKDSVNYFGDITLWWSSYTESDCFPTNEEAQSECDRRNKETAK